jgi:tight adherence protein B
LKSGGVAAALERGKALASGAIALSQRGLQGGTHRAVLLGFVVLGVFAVTTITLANPKSFVRRAAAGYVARLDAQQRWMFQASTGERIAWTQLAAVLLLLLVYGVWPNAVLLGVAALAVVVPPAALSQKVAARRARIDEQANGFALALGNALKATASIGDALRGATDVTAKPLADELGTVLRQVRVGSTMEEALLSLSARVQSTALDVVVSALLIGRQTGGDLPRILEGTAASLRDLKRLENLTDKVTRSAKQSLAISASVTVCLAAGLPQIFPGFLDPLRTTLKGQVYTAQMIVVFLVALYLGYRFTRKSI